MVQEHILTNNILKHLDRNSILTDCQHGFRARRSCDTQLLSLKHELAISLDSGIQQDLIILYFSKAFDKVPHQRLSKLNFDGIRGTTLSWIKAFLSGRSQQVGEKRSRMFAWVSLIRVGSRISWSNIEFLLISSSWLHYKLWDDFVLIFSLVESIPGRLKSPPSHRCAPLCVGILARYDSSVPRYSCNG
jgi:hypothetical protein